MILRTNPDGSTSWIPTDPGNTDYRNELVNRLKAEKFETDEAFFIALQAEARRVQAETDEKQAEETKRALEQVKAKTTDDNGLAAKLKAAIKTLTPEEIARIIG